MTTNYLSDLASTNLVFAVFLFSSAVLMLLFRPTIKIQSRILKPLMIIFVLLVLFGLDSAILYQFSEPSWVLFIPVLINLIFIFLVNSLMRGLHFIGTLLISAHLNVTLAGLLWGISIILSADVSLITNILMSIAFTLTTLTLFVGFIQSFEQWEVICRRKRGWQRPRLPAPVTPRSFYPKVSLHVPTYSEPPELVIATLNSLAKLDYPNYEVLLIDNNTSDPDLWRPVEEHCKSLGNHFRFYHIDKLPGAKAGALNFALRHTDKDAELVGVIDSDYIVNSNFLSSLVDFFDDTAMGFVQTPQAYREWDSYSYLRMCNWEYKLVFSTTLVSRNERMAAITVGTMGLIRRSALEQVGGWAEWCLTEDSELSVRIHAAGYRSMYLNKVFGNGLIPETFQDYKKQRFRWTYGPIQELRRHFRLFLPKPLAKSSALTPAQKIHHVTHGLGALKSGLEFLLLLLGVVTFGSMLFHGETIQIPIHIWQVLGIAAISAFVLKWHLFHKAMACRFKDMIGAMMATMALNYVIRMASLKGLFTRNAPWRRTNKFKALPLGLRAIGSTMQELVLGVTMLAIGISVFVADDFSSLIKLIAVGCIIQGVQFLFSPLMAIIAEYGVNQRALANENQTLQPQTNNPQTTET